MLFLFCEWQTFQRPLWSIYFTECPVYIDNLDTISSITYNWYDTVYVYIRWIFKFANAVSANIHCTNITDSMSANIHLICKTENSVSVNIHVFSNQCLGYPIMFLNLGAALLYFPFMFYVIDVHRM